MFEPQVFRKQMYCIEVVTMLRLFGAPRSDSVPGELCPPRYAPGCRCFSTLLLIENHLIVFTVAAYHLFQKSLIFSNVPTIPEHPYELTKNRLMRMLRLLHKLTQN